MCGVRLLLSVTLSGPWVMLCKAGFVLLSNLFDKHLFVIKDCVVVYFIYLPHAIGLFKNMVPCHIQ